MLSNLEDKKLEISYPCEWECKIIGTNELLIRNAIEEIIKDRTCAITNSNKSKTGKYISLKLKFTLLSEDEKNIFYSKLAEHKEIKFIL